MRPTLAFLFSGLLFSAIGFAQPLTQFVDGVGYQALVNRHIARPETAPLLATAQADATRKCLGLFGPKSTLAVHSAPHWLESEPDQDGTLEREFSGVYVCTAGTEDSAWLLAHFLDLIQNPPPAQPHDLSPLDSLASWQIRSLGEPAVPALLQALRKPHPETVTHLLQSALLNTGSASWDVVEYFLAGMRTGEEMDREDAASNLRVVAMSKKVDAPRLIAALQPFLLSEDLETRRLAYDALGGLGARAAAVKSTLWQQLNQNPTEFVPPTAADALADIGGELSDLPKLQAFIDLEGADEQLKAGVLYLTLGIGKPALPLLHHAIGTYSPPVVRQALHLLPKIGLSTDAKVNTDLTSVLLWLAKIPEYQDAAKDAVDVFTAPEREAALREKYAREAAATRARLAELEVNSSLGTWVQSLAATDVSVRWAAKDHLKALPVEQVVPAVAAQLAQADENARAGAMEFLRDLGGAAKSAKPALWAMVRQFPAGSEDHLALGATLVALGVGPEDVSQVHEALALPGLSASRRASLVQVAGALGALGRPLVADLAALLRVDLVSLSAEAASPHNNPVDGDVYLAVVALGKIGPSGTAIDATVVQRLQELAGTDDFNVPAWLRSDANAAIGIFRK